MVTVTLKLEDIKVGMLVTGIVPGYVSRIVSVEPAGSDAVTVIVKSDLGVAEQQLFHYEEISICCSKADCYRPHRRSSPAYGITLEIPKG